MKLQSVSGWWIVVGLGANFTFFFLLLSHNALSPVRNSESALWNEWPKNAPTSPTSERRDSPMKKKRQIRHSDGSNLCGDETKCCGTCTMINLGNHILEEIRDQSIKLGLLYRKTWSARGDLSPFSLSFSAALSIFPLSRSPTSASVTLTLQMEQWLLLARVHSLDFARSLVRSHRLSLMPDLSLALICLAVSWVCLISRRPLISLNAWFLA